MKFPTRISTPISKPTADWLRDEAHKLGISVADFVRRLLDQARGT